MPLRVPRATSRLLAVLLLIGTAGCQSRPKLVPVRGVVLKGKQPVAGVLVHFAPDLAKGNQTLDAYGQTDTAGSFTLRTPTAGEGVVAGHYKVLVTTDEGSKAVPKKFSDLETTTLWVHVAESGLADYQLHLDEGGR